MKKFVRIIALAALSLLFVLGAAACGKEDNSSGSGEPTDPGDGSTVTYTVNVECSSEIDRTTAMLTLSTVRVTLTDDSGTAVTDPTPLTNGKATFSLAAGKYKVALSGALENLDVPEKTLTATSRTVTVTLGKKSATGPVTGEKTTYAVTLLLPDGRPAPQTLVTLCVMGDTGNCTAASTDQATGVATFELDPQAYEVHVDKNYWPEGCAFDNARYLATANNTNLTVRYEQSTTYKITVQYENGDPVANVPVNLSRQVQPEGSTGKPSFTGTTNAQGVAEIVAASTSYYVDLDLSELAEYTCPRPIVDIPVSTEFPENECTVVLSSRGRSKDSPLTLREGNSTANLTASNTCTWYRFDANGVPGTYKISTTTEGAYINYFVGTIAYISSEPADSSRNTGSGAEVEFVIMNYDADNNGNITMFQVGKSSVAGNDTVAIVVTRTGNAPEETSSETVTVEAKQVVSAVPTPAGTFHAMTLAEGATVVYSESEGFYRLGTTTGPIVFVTIAGTKYTPQFGETFGEGLEMALFTVQHSETETGYYNNFIRSYVNEANADGLTPLTKELKAFLQGFAKGQAGIPQTLGWPDDSECLFVYACCYFA